MTSKTESEYHSQMNDILTLLLIEMDNVPGWKEWQKEKFNITLNHDDPKFVESLTEVPREFVFPEPIEAKHSLLMQYFELRQAIENFKNIEFYFRRYPFRGLPITYKDHLTFVCEAYFSKFYEIKGRIKNTLNALKKLDASNTSPIGEIIKLYDDVFDRELRQRNRIAHHAVFDDVELSRLFLAETLIWAPGSNGRINAATRQEYRAIVRIWAKRVRLKSGHLMQFLELIEKIIVESGKLPAATKEQKDRFNRRNKGAT